MRHVCQSCFGEPLMSQKPETVFWRRIKPLLEALPNTFVERVQQVSIRGTPDVFLCVNGWFVVLELKRDEDEEPDKLQQFKLNCVTNARGVAIVCCPENWESVFSYLKELACEHPLPPQQSKQIN